MRGSNTKAPQHGRDDSRHRQAQPNAHESAEERQRHRLDQELQQHLPPPRPNGEADADLAGPLGDGHEHDVHDADAAHQQADGRDDPEEGGEDAGRALDNARDLGHVLPRKVVVLPRRDAPPPAQQPLDVGLHAGRGGLAHRRGEDEVHVVGARDAAMEGAEGREDEVVLVHPEGRLAPLLQHAHHAAGGRAQADGRADRVLQAEELLPDGGPEQAHERAGPQLPLRERAPFYQWPVARRQVVVRRARGGGRPVFVAVDGDDGGGRRGRHRLDARHLALEGLHVGPIEGLGPHLHAAVLGPRARSHDDQVAAEAGDLAGDLRGGSAPQRHHADDGPHPNHDAENGEDRAHGVAPDLTQGQPDGAPDHAGRPPRSSGVGTAGRSRSDTTRPSRKRTMRPA
jgi:hypothetical protein